MSDNKMETRPLIDSSKPQSRRLHLLLADKDDITLFAHRRVAEASGCFLSIRTATNGLSVFDLINAGIDGTIPAPDLILFDIDLPVINGITLLKVLRRSDQGIGNTVLAVLTSSLSTREREIAQTLGVSHFLTKPLTAKSLLQVVVSLSGSVIQHQDPRARTGVSRT